MGAMLNALPLHATDSLQKVSPNRADWLTSHADATGLAVVEVERLWNRFRQLTGSNDQPVIYIDGGGGSNELNSDIFMRNLIKNFPPSNTDSNTIPFGYFIVVMQFFDGTSVDRKLAAIFLYLNNGEPVTAPMISKLLQYVYPQAKDDEVRALSGQFMRQLGSTENGQLNQQQFVTGVQRLIPPDELEELLRFDIIPSHILEEVNQLPSLPGSAMDVRTTRDNYGSNDLISDDQLRQIANQASRKNWSKLGLALGFLEYDIEAFRAQNNYDNTAALYELLRTWREQEGLLATKDRLRNSLRQGGFDELIPILN